MGCVQSAEPKPNIFKVTNIDDDGNSRWTGELEVNPMEIVLHRKGLEPIRWPLRCLRRYGHDSAELFSFESGRRSQTGEGIFAFRCKKASVLFETLQECLQRRAYALEDPIPAPSGTGVNGPSQSFSLLPQHTTSSPNGTLQAPHQRVATVGEQGGGSYLDPAPLTRATPLHTISIARLSSISSGGVAPLSPTSPNSPSSVNNILEVTPLPSLPRHQPSSTNQSHSNVYQEFPVRLDLNRSEYLQKKLSLDIPPQEQAPSIMLSTRLASSFDNETRLYENTTILSPSTAGGAIRPPCSLPGSPNVTAPMYMNVTPGSIAEGNPTEVTAVAATTTSRGFDFSHEIFTNVELPSCANQSETSEPCTPSDRRVNYIVLDLDSSNNNNANEQPETVSSPTEAAAVAAVEVDAAMPSGSNNNNSSSQTPKASFLLPESPKKTSAGYATIDFNKTVALSNTIRSAAAMQL